MTERPRIHQGNHHAESSPDEHLRAELNRVRSAFVGALSREELLVGAFLSQMGPAVPPAGLIERTCQRLREAAESSASSPGPVRRVAESMGWVLTGPALALNTTWAASYGARQTVQGLSVVRYTWGLLPLPEAPERPRQQGRWQLLSTLWRTGQRGQSWARWFLGRRGA